jgi:hypothetical protein
LAVQTKGFESRSASSMNLRWEHTHQKPTNDFASFERHHL